MATKIITNNFLLYGLNRKRNFLEAPLCECGCGKKMYFVLEDKDEVISLCEDLLLHTNCEEAAVFCVFKDGTHLGAMKIPCEDQIIIEESNDMHFFSDLDGEYRFCCYGLLCEMRTGEWHICE